MPLPPPATSTVVPSNGYLLWVMRVEYRLAELGLSLLGPLGAVREWAETHVPEVLEAQGRA